MRGGTPDSGCVPAAECCCGHGPHLAAGFVERGLDGLSDEPRSGAPRKTSDAGVERVIAKTPEESPKNATHWSTRSMAAATGMSQSAISRICRLWLVE
ncbi:helix-turn-helix domain-containing protein [Streptomyces sp. NPDC005566]|uniref:helix-turn-helix domain-containing protein n=1 Tax=Streptomyces sp. NPDC005566 TaxID=3156886 RepID=UPI0033AD2622